MKLTKEDLKVLKHKNVRTIIMVHDKNQQRDHLNPFFLRVFLEHKGVKETVDEWVEIPVSASSLIGSAKVNPNFKAFGHIGVYDHCRPIWIDALKVNDEISFEWWLDNPSERTKEAGIQVQLSVLKIVRGKKRYSVKIESTVYPKPDETTHKMIRLI